MVTTRTKCKKYDLLRPVEIDGKIIYYAPFFDVEVTLESVKALEVSFFSLVDKFASYVFSTLILIIIIVPIITFILIKEGREIKKNFLDFIPNRYFEFAISTIYEVDNALRDFVTAKLIQSLIITIVSAILFMILGVKLPILLAIILGLFNIIPYFGPFIGLIIAVLTTLLIQGFNFAILTVIVIAIVQFIDNVYLQPFLIARLVDQHPLIVIATTLLGAQLMGIIGMVLAVPIYSILKIILVKSYYALNVAHSREDTYDKLICSIKV
jgi:predicted PurR-regulated permease PerM